MALQGDTRRRLAAVLEAAGVAVSSIPEAAWSKALKSPEFVPLLADRMAASTTTGLSVTEAALIRRKVSRAYQQWVLGGRLYCIGTGGAHTSDQVGS